MKKIGEYTARGRIAHREVKEITLFDGRFDTGYRVVSFVLAPVAATDTAADVAGMLATEAVAADFANWDWSDQRQIAWCGTRGGRAAPEDGIQVVDPDNFIVEDLFIVGSNAATGDNTDLNYLIIMEKYDTTDWMGALTMVRNSAQDV